MREWIRACAARTHVRRQPFERGTPDGCGGLRAGPMALQRAVQNVGNGVTPCEEETCAECWKLARTIFLRGMRCDADGYVASLQSADAEHWKFTQAENARREAARDEAEERAAQRLREIDAEGREQRRRELFVFCGTSKIQKIPKTN